MYKYTEPNTLGCLTRCLLSLSLALTHTRTHTHRAVWLMSHFSLCLAKGMARFLCGGISAHWLLPSGPPNRSQQLDKEAAFSGSRYNSYWSQHTVSYSNLLFNLKLFAHKSALLLTFSGEGYFSQNSDKWEPWCHQSSMNAGCEWSSKSRTHPHPWDLPQNNLLYHLMWSQLKCI